MFRPIHVSARLVRRSRLSSRGCGVGHPVGASRGFGLRLSSAILTLALSLLIAAGPFVGIGRAQTSTKAEGAQTGSAQPQPGSNGSSTDRPQGLPAPRDAEVRPALTPLQGRESVEADVSTRSVAVTSGFTGVEIVVFGSVDNSRQESAEAGLYDIVVVVEGTSKPLIARRKSRVGGIWINTSAVQFEKVPSYYAISSTRPLEEVADTKTLMDNGIGFEHVPMTPLRYYAARYPPTAIKAFKSAVVRLKQKENLYVKEDYGVVFIGRSLFRASINLPANVPVGPLVARVYLFRDGQLLSQYLAHVQLEREGVERFLHMLAFRYPTFYGLFAVGIAVGAGLVSFAFFRRAGT